MQKIPLRSYLIKTVGKTMAQRILTMNQWEKENCYIIVTGRQGPTGKTTLCRVLREHGYKVLEQYLHITVRLDDELQDQMPEFSKYVE